MSNHPNAYISEGKAATLARKAFRKDVAAGRASWTDRLPAELRPHPEMAQGAPVAPVRQPLPKARRPFGEGILRSLPTYRAPFTMEDAEWWAEESRKAEDAEIDRMAEVAAYEARFDGWF